MAGDDVEALCANVAAASLGQPTNKPSSSNPSAQPIVNSSRRVPRSIKPGKSLNAASDQTATIYPIHARKDSHSGNDDNESKIELSEVKTLRTELERLKQQNRGLKEEAERYKIELEKVHSENCSITRELGNEKTELEACQQELKGVEQLNQRLRCLYGMEDIDFEEISVEFDNANFKKTYNDDYSTEVALKAEFKVTLHKDRVFPPQTFWKRDGDSCRHHDRGAITVVKILGQLYFSKCGNEQENVYNFIDREKWTTEVVLLSRKIGLPLKRKDAKHAELQLMAFCITRLLDERGLKMADFLSPEAYKAGSKLISCIDIYVSQKICPYCQNFVEKLNKFTKDHGFMFNPVNKGKDE